MPHGEGVPTFCGSYIPLKFYILLTVYLGAILVNNQLHELFNVFIYFTSLHVSSNPVLIIRKLTVSIQHLVYITLCR